MLHIVTEKFYILNSHMEALCYIIFFSICNKVRVKGSCFTSVRTGIRAKTFDYIFAQSYCLPKSTFRSHSVYRPTRMNKKIGATFKSLQIQVMIIIIIIQLIINDTVTMQ